MNPHKLSLTSGGSSSGEGALVGIRGALIGLGSDIAGSVRAPALFNGAYGFKPTQDRLPYSGQQKLLRKGWPATRPTLGPLAVSAEDLTLVTKTLVLNKPWIRDSTAVAVPWRQVARPTRLRIGFFLEDASLPVRPPVKRALRLAAEGLKAAGHEVITLDQIPSVRKAMEIMLRGFALDTSNTTAKLLAEAGEEPTRELIELQQVVVLDKKDGFSLDDLWRFGADRQDYVEEWAKIWRDHSLDVVLCPGFQGVAPLHGQVGVPFYCAPWNLLDVCPIVAFSMFSPNAEPVDDELTLV